MPPANCSTSDTNAVSTAQANIARVNPPTWTDPNGWEQNGLYNPHWPPFSELAFDYSLNATLTVSWNGTPTYTPPSGQVTVQFSLPENSGNWYFYMVAPMVGSSTEYFASQDIVSCNGCQSAPLLIWGTIATEEVIHTPGTPLTVTATVMAYSQDPCSLNLSCTTPVDNDWGPNNFALQMDMVGTSVPEPRDAGLIFMGVVAVLVIGRRPDCRCARR